jgi:hypothetical protein
MSLVVKDPKSDKKISATLIAEQKRHSELPTLSKFLKALTETDLAFNSTDFPAKVAAAIAAEGIKIHNGSILDIAMERLKKHNNRYLDIVIGKVDFGTYSSSVLTNFGMTTTSKKLPDQDTHAEIMGVSELIATGDLALIDLSLTPPLDFTAAENAAFRLDCNNKITIFNTSRDDWEGKESALAIRRGIVKPLATTIRKEVQFHVSDKTEAEMRTYCGTFGIVFAIEKLETEIDVLTLYADGSGIAPGITLRIGKLFTSENKVKKIESVQGVKAVVNAHGEAVLYTTQTGEELFLIWEGTGIIKGSAPINIVAGEDQSLTIHVVKSPPEV